MIAWRLCRRPHVGLDGEGARRFGGRWNSPGRPMVYLADHPALAALEVRVHLDLPFDLLPADYVLMRVDIPEPASLDPATTTIKAGNAWLATASSATVRVPSVLVPHAWNLLVNPRHQGSARAETLSIEPFGFDPRLWHPLASEG
jgi:RES domain-containing protein